jgi:hypothetical protein
MGKAAIEYKKGSVLSGWRASENSDKVPGYPGKREADECMVKPRPQGGKGRKQNKAKPGELFLECVFFCCVSASCLPLAPVLPECFFYRKRALSLTQGDNPFAL